MVNQRSGYDHEILVSGQNSNLPIRLHLARDQNGKAVYEVSEHVPAHDERIEWSQRNWLNGHGQYRFEDPDGYYDGQSIDTTQEGRVLLGPKITQVYVGSTKYENLEATKDDYENVDSVNLATQTFTPSATHPLAWVKLYLARGDSSPGTITVGIYATDGTGKPTGSALATGTTDGTTLTTSTTYGWRTVNFSPGVSVLASTKYAIVVSCEGEPEAASTTLRPNGAGDEAALTVYPSGANYLAVDEVVTDENTTFVYAPTPDAYLRDLYGLETSGLTNTIVSVVVTNRANFVLNSGSATGVLKTAVKTHGVVYLGSETPLTSSYTNISTTYTVNPNTSAAWTWSEVNALQAGVSMKAISVGECVFQLHCTQVYVTVNFSPLLRLYWGSDSSTPGYADGSSGMSADTGATWTMNTAQDFLFSEGTVAETELSGTPTQFLWASTAGKWICADSAKVYIYDTSWTAATTTLAGVTHLAEYNGILYAAMGAAVKWYYSTDADTWTQTDLTNGYAVKFLVAPNPEATADVLWAAKTPNEFCYTTDGRTVAAGGVQLSSPAYIGDTTSNITNPMLHSDEIAIGRADNLYQYKSGGGTVPLLNELRNARSVENFRYYQNWQGGTYFSMGNGVRELVGSLPGVMTAMGSLEDTGDIDKVGVVRGIAADVNYIYVAMLEGTVTHIYKGKPNSNGTWSWCPWVYLGTNQSEVIAVAQHSTTDRRLWFGYGTHTGYVQITDNPTTDANARFAASGFLRFSYRYGNNPYWDKMIQSIVTETAGCAAGITVTPKYRKDSETSMTALTAAITSNGVNKTNLTAALSGKRFQFEVDLATNDSTITPQVLMFAARGHEKPESYRVHDCTYLIGDNPHRRTETVKAWLEAARTSTTLVKFADLRFGENTGGTAGTDYKYVTMLPGYPAVTEVIQEKGRAPELALKAMWAEVNFT